ncbi:MAG: twin-arginine translocation signal domain-containing protein [Anaerolineae bacterium]|nr:twin-arginine translocation signal domain-containing protein [Anaerolineae bacterium]
MSTPNITRREFLTGAIATAAGLLAGCKTNQASPN